MFCQCSALVWASANNPFGFNFKDFSLPGFPKGKKGSSIFDGLDFFSDKHPAKFGGLPGLPNHAQKQSSGSDMLGTMCGMVPMPFVCDSKSQGVNSAQCKKNPAACCGKSVKKCSDTDPFTFASPCGAVSQNAKCVGSVLTSFTKVGVCMCQGGSTCQGAGSRAKCSTGSMANIFSNLEEEDEIEAEADLNISGWLALVTLFTCLLLSVSLSLRGMRWLRSNGGHREHSQLLQDVEAEVLD